MTIRRNEGRATVMTIIIVLAVLVGIAVIVGVATKRLYVGVKTPTEQVALVQHICTKDDITKYNQVTSSTDEFDAAGLAKTITSRADYKSDASCAYMVYHYALRAKDDTLAQSSFEALKSLNNKGVYVSGSIDNLASISQLETLQSMYKTRTTGAGAIEGEG